MLLGYKSIRMTEINSHLNAKHLHSVIGQLSGPKMGAMSAVPVSPECEAVDIIEKRNGR